MTEINDKEFLQDFCHLCLSGSIFEARCAIVDASQFSFEELESVSDEGMEDYVLENIHDPTIHKMVEIERTLKNAFQVVDINEPTDSSDALIAVKKIDGILPYMSRADKVFAKYLQCRCYRYVDSEDDTEHFGVLKEVVEGYPYYHETERAKKFNKFLINEINSLSVPAEDKYKVIKLAQTNSPEHIRHHYKSALSPLADFYFSEKLRQASEPTSSYQDKIIHYKEALESIEDIDVPEDIRREYADKPREMEKFKNSRHHKRELLVLGRLGKLHKENNNPSGVRAVTDAKRKLIQNFCRKRFKAPKAYSHDI